MIQSPQQRYFNDNTDDSHRKRRQQYPDPKGKCSVGKMPNQKIGHIGAQHIKRAVCQVDNS